jgi:hypothetical protein
MMMSNISNINVEQAQFTAVVSREADREASDGQVWRGRACSGRCWVRCSEQSRCGIS